MSSSALVQTVQRAQWASAESGSHTVAVGPMLATFDGVSTIPHRNYAVAGPKVPAAAEVSALIELYRSRQLLPRMELLAPSQELLDVLLSNGFSVHERLPIMALELLKPRSAAGFTVRFADSAADLMRCAEVQNAAYGEGPPTEVDGERLGGTVRAGGWVALATEDSTGTSTGSGLASPIRHGAATVAAVGTLEAYRRRGTAAAVVTELTRAVTAAGGLPWLECESENETRLYGKLGYVTFGEEIVVTADEA